MPTPHSLPSAPAINGPRPDRAAPPAVGIYLHWPFCARKCPYCDFYTFGAEHPQFAASDRYLAALLAEIRRFQPAELAGSSAPPRVDTIYFGGGTPSLIEPHQFAQIMRALREAFEIAPDAEITMEVNPTAAEADRLAPARELGVNRLSVGCQSFDDGFLRLLGRDHDAGTARRVVGMIPGLGFDNFSLDLMFSLPGQTLEDTRRDVETALGFGPAHISAYGLTLHDGTPFKRWHAEGRWAMPESDHQAAQFEMMMDRLAEAGFEQYEISNWSRPGRASRHNSKYWARADVIAFGVSAHGVIGGRRYSNPRDLEGYLTRAVGGTRGDSPAKLQFESPPAEPRSRLGEIMMLALRRTGGVEWAEVDDWARAWHPDRVPDEAGLRGFYRVECASLAERGLLEDDGARFRLTRRGVLLGDEVMAEFF